MYEITQSEPELWTVGYRRPDTGRWEPESDHGTPREARERAHQLNGVEAEYVYLQSEPTLWTVGEFIANRFEPVSDHGSPDEAAAEVIKLNA